jgi:hypothetical protein
MMIFQSVIQWKELMFGAPSPPRMSEVEADCYASTEEYELWFWENLGKQTTNYE